MKPRILPAAAALLAVAALPAFAATIDLPGLVGDYAVGAEPPPGAVVARSVTFAFPDSIGGLGGLRLQMAGSWNPGLFTQCRTIGGNTVCDTLPCGTHLVLRLTAAALGEGGFVGSVSAYDHADGSVDLIPLAGTAADDIDLLLPGPVNAELACEPSSIDPADIVAATWGTLAEVSLETIGAVPADGRRWGGIKALFR